MLTIDVCVSHNAGSQASIWQMKLANCTLLRHLREIGHVGGKKNLSPSSHFFHNQGQWMGREAESSFYS